MKIRDLSNWEAFYWVAQERSFTAAAKRLKTGLPLVSRRVSLLESELGVKLFHRSTRRVSLTDEGRSLLPHLTSVLEDLHGLEARFETQGKLSGTIRMTCTPAVANRILSPLLVEFTRTYPDVKFELDLSGQVIDLIASQMDLAIRIDEPSPSELIFKRLGSNPLGFCASPAYLKMNPKPLRSPKDLKNHLVLSSEVHDDCRFMRGGGRLRDFLGHQAVLCEDAVFLTRLALDGGGIAIRSLWDVDAHFKKGELVQVLENHPLEDYAEVYAVIPGRRYLAPRVRTFIDFLSVRWPGK